MGAGTGYLRGRTTVIEEKVFSELSKYKDGDSR